MAGTGGVGALLGRPVTVGSAVLYVKQTAVLLRIAEFVLALLCASTAGVGVPARTPSWYVFLILVAVGALIFDAGILVVYASGRSWLDAKFFTATYLPMAEMLFSFVWAVFWMAASVSFAAQVPQANGSIGTCGPESPPGFSNELATAAVVFGFFSCIVWAYSSVLAFLRFRDAPTYQEGLLSESAVRSHVDDPTGAPVGEATATAGAAPRGGGYGAI